MPLTIVYNFSLILRSIIIALLCLLTSCKSHHLIVGKWETTDRIIRAGDRHTIKIPQGDWFYYTMVFNPEGSLVLGGRDKGEPGIVSYSLQHDTIIITANNGHVSVVPIVKLTKKELQTLNIIDSSVTIFRRAR